MTSIIWQVPLAVVVTLVFIGLARLAEAADRKQRGLK